MCSIAIGTDTGGSVRIPAALCGLVGFKPSRQRVPTEGVFPLSKTLDSVRPIAHSVADCAKADAIMAGEEFSNTLVAGNQAIKIFILLKVYGPAIFVASNRPALSCRR